MSVDGLRFFQFKAVFCQLHPSSPLGVRVLAKTKKTSSQCIISSYPHLLPDMHWDIFPAKLSGNSLLFHYHTLQARLGQQIARLKCLGRDRSFFDASHCQQLLLSSLSLSLVAVVLLLVCCCFVVVVVVVVLLFSFVVVCCHFASFAGQNWRAE